MYTFVNEPAKDSVVYRSVDLESIRKYGSTFYVGIGEVKNGCLYT